METLRKLSVLFIILSWSARAYEERNLSESVISDISSPFTTNARYIVYGGVLATSLAYFNQKNQTYQKRESFKDAKPLGDIGVIGDVLGYGLLNVGYIAYFTWKGRSAQDEKSMLNAEVMARASLYSTGLTMLLKNTISEKRPGYPDDQNSFPSGHASGAFSFASVVAARHGWYYGSMAYGLAGFIAVSRVNDDFHYLHDILAGITIGAAFGWGVHYNLERGNRTWFTLIPTPERGLGIALGRSF